MCSTLLTKPHLLNNEIIKNIKIFSDYKSSNGDSCEPVQMYQQHSEELVLTYRFGQGRLLPNSRHVIWDTVLFSDLFT